MEYTVKYLRWAPFAKENPETPGKLPKYDAPVTLGELNKVVITPSFNEAKAYGDGALARNVNKFKEGKADVTILDISKENMSAISGAEIETGDHKNLRFRTEDNAPYGGMGFVAGTLLSQNVAAYFGIFIPKEKAALQGKEYDTNGENITLASQTLSFTYSAAMSGDFTIESPYFDTEEEAKAWVDGMFDGTSTDIGKDSTEVQTAAPAKSRAGATETL